MRLDEYTLDVNVPVEVVVVHGTFDRSVYCLDWADEYQLTLAGPSSPESLHAETWTKTGYKNRPWRYWQKLKSYFGQLDRRLTSSFQFVPDAGGTHVIGLVLKPAGATMEASTFSEYLKEVGLSEEPLAQHGFDDPNFIITERYRKSIKTIVQVGHVDETWADTPLGHPAEIVSLQNPGRARKGDALEFMLLLNGEPNANQPVIVSTQKRAFTKEYPTHQKIRSDADGRIVLPITESGVWWLSFVHLEKQPPVSDFHYKSEWATLTFEIP